MGATAGLGSWQNYELDALQLTVANPPESIISRPKSQTKIVTWARGSEGPQSVTQKFAQQGGKISCTFSAVHPTDNAQPALKYHGRPR
jgi:hypothetical protein